MRREMEAERFVREFQHFPSGVDLAKELKVTDAQVRQLAIIVDRVTEECSQQRGRRVPVAGAPIEELQKRMLENAQEMAAIFERAKNDIAGVLSPEQVARAQQIGLQNRLRISGMARGLASEAADVLGLTPDQIAKLQEAETGAQQQLHKELQALRDQERLRLAEARKRVLSVLTPPQQAIFEKLVGEPLPVDDRSLDYGVAGISSRLNQDRPRLLGFGSGPGGVGSARGAPPVPLPAAVPPKP